MEMERKRKKKKNKKKNATRKADANADMSYCEKQWSKTGEFRVYLRQNMQPNWPSNSKGKWRETVWNGRFTLDWTKS